MFRIIQKIAVVLAIALIAGHVFASSEGYQRASKYMNVNAEGEPRTDLKKYQKRKLASAKKTRSHKNQSK